MVGEDALRGLSRLPRLTRLAGLRILLLLALLLLTLQFLKKLFGSFRGCRLAAVLGALVTLLISRLVVG